MKMSLCIQNLASGLAVNQRKIKDDFEIVTIIDRNKLSQAFYASQQINES